MLGQEIFLYPTLLDMPVSCCQDVANWLKEQPQFLSLVCIWATLSCDFRVLLMQLVGSFSCPLILILAILATWSMGYCKGDHTCCEKAYSAASVTTRTDMSELTCQTMKCIGLLLFRAESFPDQLIARWSPATWSSWARTRKNHPDKLQAEELSPCLWLEPTGLCGLSCAVILPADMDSSPCPAHGYKRQPRLLRWTKPCSCFSLHLISGHNWLQQILPLPREGWVHWMTSDSSDSVFRN